MYKSDFHYSKNTICCKWYNNKPVLLMETNVDGMSRVSNIMKRTKVSAITKLFYCPSIFKVYNNDMGVVDIMDKKTAA